jgi:hypothetical protein
MLTVRSLSAYGFAFQQARPSENGRSSNASVTVKAILAVLISLPIGPCHISEWNGIESELQV